MDSFLITADGTEREVSPGTVRRLLDTSARFWLDLHLSTVSNRLNVVMKQLTIIATIFLPLSFLTGFFGQNFVWMVTRITSLPAFLAAGIALPAAVVVALVVVLRRRGWLSADCTVPPARPAHRPQLTRQERWHLLTPLRKPQSP